MVISKDSLDRFKAIYTEQFGEELQDDEAEEKARMVLNLFTAVYRSPTEFVKEAINQEHE